VENTKSRTKSSSDIRDISKVGIEIGKKKAKYKKCKSKPNDDDRTPSGVAIHSGQYLAKDNNKLKPFGKAKVKQLRDEAKRKEKNNKPDARSVAIVETQEEAPPDDDNGIKTPVVSNAGKQFGCAAHSESQKQASRYAPALVKTDPMLGNSYAREAGPPSTLFSPFVKYVFRVLASKPSGDDNDTRTEYDSHADTCVAGCNTLLVSDEGCQVTVHPYCGEYNKPIQNISIATVATMWTHPTTGQPYILIINKALYFGDRVDVTPLGPQPTLWEWYHG
jgi:hypothetical protein